LKEYKLQDVKIIKNASFEDDHATEIIEQLKELED
jgi:hypothetical protein